MDAPQVRSDFSRHWPRPHFSTWLTLLLPAAVLVLANVPGEYRFDWNDRRAVGCEHGWPRAWLMRQGMDPGCESLWALHRDVCYVDAAGLTIDILTAIAILVSLGALVEWRRRRRHLACQFTLVDWMVAVGIFGLLLADVADRREKLHRAIREATAAGGDIYDLELDLPTWLREISPDSECVYLAAWRLGLIRSGSTDFDLPADVTRMPVLRPLIELSPEHASVTVCRRPPSENDQARNSDPSILRSLGKLRHLTLERADASVLDGLDPLTELRSLMFDESCDPLSAAAAARLKRFKHLRFLSATRRCLGDAGVAAVAMLATLEAVSLSGASDVDLAELAALKQLRYLALPESTVTDAGLAALAACTKLEELTINSWQITGTGLAHLLPLRRLRGLDLCGSTLSDEGLVGLRRLTSLRNLSLRDTSVAGPGLPHLAALSRLRSLDLSETDIADSGIAFLPELPALEELRLDFTRVTERGMSVMCRLPKLRELWLMNTRVAGVSDFQSRQWPQLELLVLDGSRVDSEEKCRILALRPELQFTRWHRCGMFPLPFAQALAAAHEAAAKHACPVALVAEGPDVGDRELASLRGLPRVDTLSLQSTRVTAQGLAMLLKFDELTILDLSGASVGDAGLTHLAKLPRLSAIDLSYTDLTEVGLVRLAEFPALETVSLDPSQITDGVLSTLQRIPNLKRLSINAELGRWGERYRAARTLEVFIGQLRSALPQIEVLGKNLAFLNSQRGLLR